MSELMAVVDVRLLALSFAAGLLLGGLYLLGLWWTVRRVTETGRRGLLVVSFAVRAALLFAGLWYLVGFGPQSLIAALAGFLLMRSVVTRLARGGEADDTVT